MKYTYFNGEQEVHDMFEYRESTCEGVFEEKATREYYTIERFKKKYNYNPSDKTITVDGEKYRIDMDINKPLAEYINSEGETKYHARRVSVTGSRRTIPTITLDKDFFALKDDSRRDAILKHEIGHAKTLMRDRRGYGKATKDAYSDSTKYLTNASEHSEPSELQADAYAASHSKGGAKALKRGLREHIKKGNSEKSIQREYASKTIAHEFNHPLRDKRRTSDEELLNTKYKDMPLEHARWMSDSKTKEEYLDKVRKSSNKANSEETKYRSKALNDEELQKKMQKTFPNKKSDEKYAATANTVQQKYNERPDVMKKKMDELAKQYDDMTNSLKFTKDENKRKEIERKIDDCDREWRKLNVERSEKLVYGGKERDK